MIRLVQLKNANDRRLALVDEPSLVFLDSFSSIYDFAQVCIQTDSSANDVIERSLGKQRLTYDAVYAGDSGWTILPAAEHPTEPARCLVSGTGLTHMASAKNRNAMHLKAEELTDSIRMYRWGIEGGKPEPGEIGVAPEWFYKGTGECLRAHNEPLVVPDFAEDGGEEPEIAGVYLNDSQGVPWRIGFTQGNEFSDHELERKNYLYLAGSKLRNCSIGPELVVGPSFDSAPGTVTIERQGKTLWSRDIRSGESAMSHTVANLEHHHFKVAGHRRPGDIHIHFFGADAFSFGEGIHLEDGDIMQVHFEGYGRPLRNPLSKAAGAPRLVKVRSLTIGMEN
ncbi:MAG TPA: AraD1 family protein [Bryobacteraceae bacterium]|nr:AraD1 family protein [Bryobacteraceae bacterium]